MPRAQPGPPYVNETLVLHYHSYRAVMRAGRRLFELHPGDVTLSLPGEASSYEMAEDGFHWCIHFHPVPASAGPATRIPLHLRGRPELVLVLERMQQIIDWHRRPGRALRAAASAALQEILLYLASERDRPSRAAGGKATLALRRVARWIEGNLEKTVTVPGLAREAGLSQNYLSRLFRQHYGVTLQHYLLLRRIEVARHLLVGTRSRIKEIGARVGLPDPQHFNKQFRRMTGTSPSDLREGAKE